MAQITGSDGIDELFGTDGDDEIFGLGGNDILRGRAGNDVLDGGTGNDRMIGWLGDDVYYADRFQDTVIERFGHGIDTVFTSVNYRLSAHVENLTLTDKARTATGNDLDNIIDASSQVRINPSLGTGSANLGYNNVINGGLGADTMIGGFGSDTYYVDNIGDVVRETGSPDREFPSGPRNVDTIIASIDWTLAEDSEPGAGTAQVEDLRLTGSAVSGTGNSGDNYIYGNDQNNTLMGLDGDDALFGGDGEDVLMGGEGGDILNGGLGDDLLIGRQFAFDNIQSVDQIEGFGNGTPNILIDPDIFNAAQFSLNGILLSSNFRVGGNAVNANQHIIYNQNRGEIYYDEDGDGPIEKILFATIEPMTEIFFFDFNEYIL